MSWTRSPFDSDDDFSRLLTECVRVKSSTSLFHIVHHPIPFSVGCTVLNGAIHWSLHAGNRGFA